MALSPLKTGLHPGSIKLRRRLDLNGDCCWNFRWGFVCTTLVNIPVFLLLVDTGGCQGRQEGKD